ncbi:SRPBCC family protein [Nitrosococcus wardiae]|uniref:SRPBCC family protein n=1 Tax=Nitrosococcus wardiae TaxID=1814290 RepID=A0A4V1AWD6_9GAMM|nr:SRPBCC family protein [Nitrosococcus wardiae]QBQ56265.1 SRPBCC family protein [Nitrosococcus wardiae]
MLNRTTEAAVQNLEVLRHHSGYVVSGQVRLQAPLETVRARLLDFNHMDRLHRSIQVSELQCSFPDGRHRVRVQVQFGILWFWFTLQSIQDFTWNERTIQAVMLPEKSDFTHGEIHWDLTPDKGDTQLQFRAELIPTFWVPPVIGPYLLKRILPEKAREIVQNLESWTAP